MKRLSMLCALFAMLFERSCGVCDGADYPQRRLLHTHQSATVNFGAKNTLEVESAGATTFVRFDLSGIPPTVNGAMVAKATLKSTSAR